MAYKMRFCIVDHDPNTTMRLTDMIQKAGLGEVIGVAKSGKSALQEIGLLQPDVVLMSYPIPMCEGPEVVRKIRNQFREIRFILISDTGEMSVVADFYRAGIEFFIRKPVHIMELIKVVLKVNEKIELERTLAIVERTVRRYLHVRSKWV